MRPEQTVHESPKSWWMYAIRCHGIHLVSKHRQHDITKENLHYLDICTRIIINPNETLTNEEKEFKDRVEKERNYEELKILREVNE